MFIMLFTQALWAGCRCKSALSTSGVPAQAFKCCGISCKLTGNDPIKYRCTFKKYYKSPYNCILRDRSRVECLGKRASICGHQYHNNIAFLDHNRDRHVAGKIRDIREKFRTCSIVTGPEYASYSNTFKKYLICPYHFVPEKPIPKNSWSRDSSCRKKLAKAKRRSGSRTSRTRTAKKPKGAAIDSNGKIKRVFTTGGVKCTRIRGSNFRCSPVTQ